MPLAPGQSLGPYEILAALGAGGMGEVYRAHDTRLNRDVAIKVLPDQFVADESRVFRFEREAKVLAALNHPGIAQIYGLEEDGGTGFLALEYVPGEDLASQLGRRLDLDDAIAIGHRLAEALEAAHEFGVIHRDLKPGNIRVTPDGAVKILDFGLAKTMLAANTDSTQLSDLAGEVELTRQGDIIGTPAYMSPEQARGRAVDRRTDIWAFGCVLYESLSGRRAFAGDSVFDVLVAVVDDEPDWSALPARMPDVVRHLLERCLTKNPQRRLRDIGEARIVLEDLAEGRDGELLTPITRSRRGTLLTTIFAVAALTVGWVIGWASQQTGETRALRGLRITPAGAAWGSSLQPAITRDGHRIAYVADNRLWIRDLAQLEPHSVEGTQGASHPFWSPDGRWLGYARSRTLWKVRGDGGQPIELAQTPEPVLANGGFAWGNDGRIIGSTAESGLFAVDAESGELSELVGVDSAVEKDLHRPSLLPDGQGALFTAHYIGRDHHSIDAFRDGTRTTVYRVPAQFPEQPTATTSGHLLFHRSRRKPRGVFAIPFSHRTLKVSGRPRLIAPNGVGPGVADNGTLVYELSGRAERLDLTWLNSGGETVAVAGAGLDKLGWAELSSDGAHATIVDGNYDVWVMDLERGALTRATSRPEQIVPFRWRPDGSAFFAISDAGGAHRIVRIAPTELNAVTVIVDENNRRRAATTTPVVYSLWSEDSGYDLWLLRAGNTPPELFIRTPGRDGDARISRQGDLVAYSSTKNGRDEIFVTTFPDKGPTVQVSVEGGKFPRWFDVGLCFVSPDNTLLSVEVRSIADIGTARPRFRGDSVGVDFHAHRYDVAADGQRILVLQDPSRGSSRPSIVVVQDWAAALER